MKTYSVWHDAQSDCYTVVYNVVDGDKKPSEVEPGAVLIKTFEAESWTDAMIQYHKWQGWEPYKPME
jgi:hypothetical protein